MSWLHLSAYSSEDLATGQPAHVFVECTSPQNGARRAAEMGMSLHETRRCGCGCGAPWLVWLTQWYPTDLYDGSYSDIENAKARAFSVGGLGIPRSTIRLGPSPTDTMKTCVYYATPNDFARANRLHLSGGVRVVPMSEVLDTNTNTAVSACPECHGTDPGCALCVEIARPLSLEWLPTTEQP